jgi:hypothetical protein
MEATVRVTTLVVAALMAVPMMLRAQQDGLEDLSEPGIRVTLRDSYKNVRDKLAAQWKALHADAPGISPLIDSEKLRSSQRASALPKQALPTEFLQHQPVAGRELRSVWQDVGIRA